MCFAPFPRMHSNRDLGSIQTASEAKLRGRIEEQLELHNGVDATKIGVVVRRGQVLLWGSVATERERATAGEVAARVAGRLSVINHIHVFQSPG
jgi:osmotically-inducible protein OsmY